MLDLAALGRSLNPRPAPHHTRRQRIEAAVEWLVAAFDGAGDGGLSKGYDTLRKRWDPSYPETTGYTIPTLLNLSGWLGRPDLRTLALTLADYLVERQRRDGGIVHWSDERRTPVVFDTGQVIFGWLAAHQATQEARFLEAARQGGDWLVAVQGERGSWVHGQHLGVEKVIDTRVAWALLLLDRALGGGPYAESAHRCLRWALSEQEADGWFHHCAFTASEDPFTHTLAYTAEGLWEAAQLTGESRYLEGAQRTVDSLLRVQRPDGGLASTFGSGWRETSGSSCLTGDCQTAELWIAFHRFTGKAHYLEAADRLLTFVENRQRLDQRLPQLHGAIPGSFPFYGIYERFKYPNWATKFFLDAELAREALDSPALVWEYEG